MTISYTLTSDVAYVSNNHARQTLDIYIPNNNTGPYPLVIYIHGGAFKVGDKKNDLLPIRLLQNNYALASLNYRLSGDAIFPAAIRDCTSAVRYLRANSKTYDIDPERFVTMGESAGAYMALMVGLPGPHPVPDFHIDTPSSSSDEQALRDDVSTTVLGTIDFYGPTDFSLMDAHAPADATLRHDPPDSPESLFLGAHITTVPELVQRANPIRYVNDGTPPVLIAHGTDDRIVPFQQSVILVEALRAKGREVVFHKVEGVDHCFWGINEVQQRELDGVVDRWLRDRFGR